MSYSGAEGALSISNRPSPEEPKRRKPTDIYFSTHSKVSAEAACEVFQMSGLVRPTFKAEPERLEAMVTPTANQIVASAWDGEKLVGIAVAMCDFSWVCFLRDVAVRKDYQGLQIGSRLVKLIRDTAGANCSCILLSSPGAVGFYENQGFTPKTNAFLIERGPTGRRGKRRGRR